VPEIVEADLWEPGPLQERLELQLGNDAPVERLSGLGGEYEAVRVARAPQGPDPIYLRELVL
jgi:hypothetical protein